MYKKKVSIITPNYNGEKYLYELISSVLKSSYRKFEFIIVDDGSTDESIKIIKNYIKKDRRIRLVKNKTNIGASASRNKGIKLSTGEFIIFLDNDTKVKSDWINKLIEVLDDNPTTGAVQSLLIDINDNDTIQLAGGKLIPQTAWLAPNFHRVSYKKNKSKLNETDIVAISASLAVKKSVINIVGGFDEKEAVTTEDLDFCWRIWLAGYSVKLAPESIVYHWTKDITDRINMETKLQDQYFHLAKNSFTSITKNYEVKNVLINLPKSIIINFVRGLLVLVKRKDPSALLGSQKGFVWYFSNLPSIISERKKVQKTRRTSDSNLFKQIFVKESLLEIYKKYFSKSKLL
jgi:GT2 family glycosyltransferase